MQNPQPTCDNNSTDRAIDKHLAEQASSQPAASLEAAPQARLEDLKLLEKKAAERDEFLSLLQHVRADYANYQKRVVKEMDAARRFACQPLVLELLPGLDNLERALQAAESAGNSSGLLEGIRMVHQQLLAALARHGVMPIDAAGRPFDPAFHEAMLEQPCADTHERTVLQELQKGYCLHDRVIRPAKVVVSKKVDAPPTRSDTPAS